MPRCVKKRKSLEAAAKNPQQQKKLNFAVQNTCDEDTSSQCTTDDTSVIMEGNPDASDMTEQGSS